jgi:A/G-specific adenine glycosylase
MDNRYFSDKLVEWYVTNKRDLPWRDTTDPYKVWLSEIILQQTRVSQGMPYYLKFVETYPTVHELAAASEQDVLRLWQGLGYYTRARNMHKCAKVVVSSFNGNFPTDFHALQKLPGIGEYTAAAIASFSFKQPVAVVDGNVFRVLSRVFGIEKEINSPEGKKIFSALANSLINPKNPDHHNQGLMEFGALHCIPKNPLCHSCHFCSQCFAAQNNLQSALPRKMKGKPSRKRYFYYIVIQKGKSLLMQKRERKDIWHGLYDFQLLELKRPPGVNKVMSEVSALFPELVKHSEIEISPPYKHVLTHQVIIAKFVLVKVQKFPDPKDKNLKFYTFDKINDLPKPVLISRFLSDCKKLYSEIL